jgi:GR25 family glycosyltransferase involved in LPS biosynthesis
MKVSHSSVLFAFAVLLVLGVVSYWLQPTPPQINDAWFINLDKDTERLAFFMSHADELPVAPQRWPGTHGKHEERWTAWEDGVCYSLSKSMDKEENKRNSKVIHNPGVIGCWLSHKRLLKHLATLPVGPQHGHFILEDDVHLVEDFKAKWEQVRHEVPSDWDIVYFGCGKPHGTKVSPHVLKAGCGERTANTGTFGYLVRHGALPYILTCLTFMNSPIDVQYYRMLTKRNVYILEPHLVYADEHVPSTILTL